ncbi:hypothetical protein D3C72_2296210 [compost metagenome]
MPAISQAGVTPSTPASMNRRLVRGSDRSRSQAATVSIRTPSWSARSLVERLAASRARQMRPPSVSPSPVSRRRAIIVSVDKRMDISFATVTFKGPGF